MTTIDTQEKPIERDAGEKAMGKRPERSERRSAESAEPTKASAREREDPFALDPLGPPSGRPW
jgi:hypothetical protein